jgi:Ni,Fe-hydrogenase III large subunit
MMLVNRISGNRVHYSMNVIGGVKRDLSPEGVKDIQATMRDLRPRLGSCSGCSAGTARSPSAPRDG